MKAEDFIYIPYGEMNIYQICFMYKNGFYFNDTMKKWCINKIKVNYARVNEL